MDEKVIYNCHTHIFTHENVPNRFFPFFLVLVARVRPLRWFLRSVLKMIVPATSRDTPHRLAAFIKAIYRKSQENNLKHLISYYPEKTKFIILPMDMAYMDAGDVLEDIDKQHEELIRLCKRTEYSEIIIPFAHIDPRRDDSLKRLSYLVEEHNFKGVKIYPTLGYGPGNPRLLNEIYPYMIEKNIPLIAHCSPGSVNNKKISKTEAYAYAHPNNYPAVMDKYPELRICLAHFGGNNEWQKHLDEQIDLVNPSWMTIIKDLITSGKYPNLYADISYAVFNFQANVPLLKKLMEDPVVASKVLFGSDYYMAEVTKYSEKQLSKGLRFCLGEEKFWQIANENPRAYLGY